MATRDFSVRFTKTNVGRTEEEATSLAPHFDALFAEHGKDLPESSAEGEGWQVRELKKVGTVWQGVFARLRDEAPNIVDSSSQEHEIDLEDGDRILEKCYFLYRTSNNVLIWQVNRSVSGTARLQVYLSNLLANYVSLPYVVDVHAMEEILQREVHEIRFTYARPQVKDQSAPSWSQDAFDLLSPIDGAVAKFELRAKRSGSFGSGVKTMLRQLARSDEVEKLRVKLTDETNFIDIFTSPIKEVINVEMRGKYPVARTVYEGLNDAYSRQAHRIPD